MGYDKGLTPSTRAIVLELIELMEEWVHALGKDHHSIRKLHTLIEGGINLLAKEAKVRLSIPEEAGGSNDVDFVVVELGRLLEYYQSLYLEEVSNIPEIYRVKVLIERGLLLLEETTP